MFLPVKTVEGEREANYHVEIIGRPARNPGLLPLFLFPWVVAARFGEGEGVGKQRRIVLFF